MDIDEEVKVDIRQVAGDVLTAGILLIVIQTFLIFMGYALFSSI